MKTRQNLIRICLLATALLLPAVAQGQFRFTTNNGAITITGYTGSGGAVTIPGAIKVNGTNLPVTSIGSGAFSEGQLANHTLTAVIIPDSVVTIGYFAFGACSSLTNLILGTNVANIGSEAFDGCTNLENVTIQNNVTNIGDMAFAYCTSLTNFNVIGQNTAFFSQGGVIFDRSQSTICVCPGGLSGSYSVPSSVYTIGAYAFRGCSSLKEVTMGVSVNNIGDMAFFDCSSLTNVAIGNSTTNISYSAFNRCVSLSSVTIPNSVASIGRGAFQYCTDLHSAFFQGNAPSADSTVFQNDSGIAYYLPGTTGWSSTLGGWPTALWYQPQPMILGNGYGLGATSNEFGFTISWATNISVVIEACTNLANPIWNPVATNTLVNGTNYFSDPQWTNYPGRFYRLRSP